MASSYTPNLRLTLPVQGELSGTWGDTVNNGITSLTDTAISGTAAVTMTDADYTLTIANGATDQARAMFITLTGTLTAARNVICPSTSKLYYVTNNTTGGFAITFKTSGGSGISVPSGARIALYCDGVNVLNGASYADAFSTTNLAYTGTLTGGTGIAAIGSTQIYKDAAGFVGLGTATPATTLHLYGTGGTSTLSFRMDSTATGLTAGNRITFNRLSTASRSSSTAGWLQFFDIDTASATFGSSIYAAGRNIAGSINQSLVYDAYTLHQFNIGGTAGSTPRVLINTDGLKVANASTNAPITSTLQVVGSFAAQVPTTVNAAAYTLLVTDFSLRFTTTNCVLTLPAATAAPGRTLYISNITANSVTSAASDVVPLGSSTAGTAILAATAGKFVMLQSDNSNWVVLMAN